MRAALIILGYLTLCGFKACNGWSIPQVGYDMIAAADDSWVVVGTNGSLRIYAVGANKAGNYEVSWNGALSCGEGWVPGGDPQVRKDLTSGQWWFAQIVYPINGRPPGWNQGFSECITATYGTDPRGPYYPGLVIPEWLSPSLPHVSDGNRLEVTGDKIALVGPWNRREAYNACTDPCQTTATCECPGEPHALILRKGDFIVGGYPGAPQNYHYFRPSYALIAPSDGAFWFHAAQNVTPLAVPAIPQSFRDALLLYGQAKTAGYTYIAMVTTDPISGAYWGDIEDIIPVNTSGAATMLRDPRGTTVIMPSHTPAVYTGTRLWIANARPSIGLYLYEVSTNPLRLVSTASVPASWGGGIGCPSLSVSPNNAVSIAFSTVGFDRWLSVLRAFRLPGDPLGYLRPLKMVHMGKDPGTATQVPSIRYDFCTGGLGSDGTHIHIAPFQDDYYNAISYAWVSPNGT